MNEETRGVIEKILDWFFENVDFLETVSWILEVDDEVIAKEDLALGYFIGSLMSIGSNVAEARKRWKKIEINYKRNLGRKLGKEKAQESWKEIEETKARGRSLKTDLTDEEQNQLRDILKLRIIPFREKIRKERAVKGLA